MTPEGWALLERGAAELGVDVSGRQEAFAELLRLLNEGNARLNLTALKTERDIVLKHFVDSLSCLRGGHFDGPLRALDLGTGGGFPSLPIALLRPELELTPLDSVRKKVAFVQETALTLGLERVGPLAGRAETIGQDPMHREHYDRVVARAVAALPVLAELALPLLKRGGRFVAQKGRLTEEEMQAGRRAAAELGGQVIEVDAFTLPVTGDARTLVVFEKLGPTPRRYPRREGVPAQQPLFWSK